MPEPETATYDNLSSVNRYWHPWTKEWQDSPAIADFIEDLEDVCKKHGLYLTFNESTVNFIVYKPTDTKIRWPSLRAAHVDVSASDPRIAARENQ